jgi:uncharacterized membrane protein
MERMLVVIFDGEHKAYEAADALQEMNENGAVGMKGAWVLTRQRDGTVSVVKTDNTLPEASMGGAVVGSLAGLFGGPVGLAVGAASGLVIGATADMARARLDQDFVEDVRKSMAPGKAALVAEIDEEEPEAIDQRMGAIGGVILRRDLSDVADADYERRAAQVRARVGQAKEAVAQDRTERKDRVKARMNAFLHRGDKDDAKG